MVKALVIGATGKQGGGTARALLKAGHQVHAFTRNPDGEAAQALKAEGAVLFKGHTDDVDSIKAAAAGTSAVFWVSMPSFTDWDEEVRGTRNVIDAARQAGSVQHLIYSTTATTDRVRQLPLWDHSPLMKRYWENKIAGEEAVRAAGFAHYTLLRPVEFMPNFLQPLASFQYRDMLKTGVWRSAFPADFAIRYIDPEDIGRVAAAAIVDPERFSGQAVEVAGDMLPVGDSIKLLAAAAGKNLRIETLSWDEALKLSEENPVLIGQLLRMQNAAIDQYSTRPLEDFGLGSFKKLKDYFEDHKAQVVETYKEVE